MHHSPVLDGLRALAVIIVIAAHAGLGGIVPGGFGVTIFFFLSGFLITSLLRVEGARDGRISLSQFYVRRILRIFPPLYITIITVAALSALGLLATEFSVDGMVRDGLFFTNYPELWGVGTGLPIPLWSLDVEEHFYLFFPIIYILFLKERRPFGAALILFSTCIIVLLIRIYNVANLTDYSSNYYWTHTRIDSILFGCCLAVWNNPILDKDSWHPKYWQSILAIFGLLITFAIRNDLFRESVRYTIQGVCLFVVFSTIMHDNGKIKRIFSSYYLKIVGLISYTLYLCHMPMFMLVEQLLPNFGKFSIAVLGILLSFAFSGAMYLWIERPISDWRRAHRAPKTKGKLGSADE